MRILLVEDDAEIVEIVKHGLERAQYRVDAVEDGSKALRAALRGSYNLIILDLMLPKMDGMQICAELRSRKVTLPILMMTARGTVADRVEGLETGADDYLPKPFDFAELLARVRSLLRRDRIHKARRIIIADLEINTSFRSVARAGNQILLTRLEYDLLELLATHEGQTISREMLGERLWSDQESFSNKIEVAVASLRKKIDRGYSVRLIQTVHGFGYKIDSEFSEAV